MRMFISPQNYRHERRAQREDLEVATVRHQPLGWAARLLCQASRHSLGVLRKSARQGFHHVSRKALHRAVKDSNATSVSQIIPLGMRGHTTREIAKMPGVEGSCLNYIIASVVN